MVCKLLSIICHIISALLIYCACFSSFVFLPLFGIYSISAIVCFVIGLVVYRRQSWKRQIGLILLFGSGLNILAFITLISIFSDPEFAKIFHNIHLDLNYFSGITTNLIVLFSGFVLVKKPLNKFNIQNSSVKLGNSKSDNSDRLSTSSRQIHEQSSKNSIKVSETSLNSRPLGENRDSELSLFLDEIKELNPKGYDLYRQAEKEKSAELFYKAAEDFDHSYDSFWGDHVFGEADYKNFLANLFISETLIEQEGVLKIIHTARKSLVLSCEFYTKCLELAPSHYWANLKLATALTASLQIEASLPYWRQANSLDSSKTAQALMADSMGFFHRSAAVIEIIYRLNLGGSSQSFSQTFLQQQAVASTMLKTSIFLAKRIHGLTNKLDYTGLNNLLAAHLWREANRETVAIISQLYEGKIDKIPCETFQIIDQLWSKHSNGHFGFRVQKTILRKILSQAWFVTEKTYWRFTYIVGWSAYVNDMSMFLSNNNLIYDLSAPQGHLPTTHSMVSGNKVGRDGVLESFYSRIESCGL